MKIGKLLTDIPRNLAGMAIGISALTHAPAIFGAGSAVANACGWLATKAFAFAPGLMGSANVLFGSTIAAGGSVAAGQGWLLASLGALGLGPVGAAVATIALAGVAIWGISKICNKIGNAIDQKIETAKAAREQQQGERAPQQEMAGPTQGQGHSQQQGQGKHTPMHQRGEPVDYTKYEGHPGNNTPEGFHQKRYLDQGGRAPIQPTAG